MAIPTLNPSARLIQSKKSDQLKLPKGRVTMKFAIIAATSALVIPAIPTLSLAQSNIENFGGNGGAWEFNSPGIATNVANPDLRKDLNTGRKAIPGKAAEAQANNPSDQDSANNVISRPSSTLVDPNRTLD